MASVPWGRYRMLDQGNVYQGRSVRVVPKCGRTALSRYPVNRSVALRCRGVEAIKTHKARLCSSTRAEFATAPCTRSNRFPSHVTSCDDYNVDFGEMTSWCLRNFATSRSHTMPHKAYDCARMRRS